MRKNAELLKLARQYFIADTGLSMANLIRKIQIAEGHVDCFATGKTTCEQMACRWRRDCLNDANEANEANETKDIDTGRTGAGRSGKQEEIS